MKNYLIANYHSHTVRCQHARGTAREYVEAAIRAGMQELGFSDHIPCPFKDGYVSGIRMDMCEAADYVKDIRSLQEEYKDRIRIYVGFEAEYIPMFFKEQTAMADELGIDYMIMGQHFLTSEQAGPYTGSLTRDADILTAYVDLVLEGMKTGRFLYLAHPDLIHYVGDDSVYQREITRLCRELKKMRIPLEINLLGVSAGKHYPREQFWEIAGQVGNDVVFGIDAHWPELIGDQSCYEKGVELAERYGLHILERLKIR